MVDPDQLDSVAGDPAYADDQAALARVLDKMHNCRGGASSAPKPRSLHAG